MLLVCYLPFIVLVLIESFQRFIEEVSDDTMDTIAETGIIDLVIIIFFTIETPLVLFQITSQIKTLGSLRVPDISDLNVSARLVREKKCSCGQLCRSFWVLLTHKEQT